MEASIKLLGQAANFLSCQDSSQHGSEGMSGKDDNYLKDLLIDTS